MSEFNLGLLKKHPYATGGIVIVGGLVVFYLLSRQGGTSSATGSNSDYAAELAANSASQQAAAAAAIQTNGQQAQIDVANINANSANLQTSAAEDVTNTQTIAQLLAQLDTNSKSLEVTESNNDAATLQNANQLTSEDNIYSLQEAGLQDEYNQAANEQANNNQTNLDALVDQLNYQTGANTTAAGIQSQALTEATGLATEEDAESAYLKNFAITNAGNFGFTDGTNIILSTLNNPTATAAVQGTSANAIASTAAGASIAKSAIGAGSSILAGLFG